MLHPELLPPGTQVGSWRVVEPAGRGAHGAVYRALRVGQEHAPPVALKLALFPGDMRFAREVEPLMLPPALYSARVAPPVRAVILRMLSLRPEQRGTAALLAQEMESAATSLPDSSAPLNAPIPEQVAGQRSGARGSPRTHLRSRRLWLAAGAAVLALALWTRWMPLGEPVESAAVAQPKNAEGEQPDTGPVGLGQAVASASTEDSPATLGPKVMAEQTPPEPQPGQTRPDAKGRCPRKRQVALNGGCWMTLSADQEECAVLRGQLYKGTCYLPYIPPGRPSTSNPADQR